MKIDYVLTAFSPAMFGVGATAHLRVISLEEAKRLVSSETRVMATRPTHERLARNTFPGVGRETVRYASLGEGINAIHLQYRGPPIGPAGELPFGAMITPYLIEVEAFSKR